MNNNRTWEALSMKDRASFIKLAMQYGYRDLDSIRNLYNNKSKEDVEGFSRWKKQIKNYKGIDVDNDDTYDYRGFYFDNPDNAWKLLKDRPDAHFTDKFKTSKHPTFSNESIYSGVKHQYNPNGIKGGKWLDDYNYMMSDDMLKASNYDISNTRKYLDEAESQHVNVYTPDGSIVMEPITVTNKFDDGGHKTYKDYASNNSFNLEGYRYNNSWDGRVNGGLYVKSTSDSNNDEVVIDNITVTGKNPYKGVLSEAAMSNVKGWTNKIMNGEASLNDVPIPMRTAVGNYLLGEQSGRNVRNGMMQNYGGLAMAMNALPLAIGAQAILPAIPIDKVEKGVDAVKHVGKVLMNPAAAKTEAGAIIATAIDAAGTGYGLNQNIDLLGKAFKGDATWEDTVNFGLNTLSLVPYVNALYKGFNLTKPIQSVNSINQTPIFGSINNNSNKRNFEIFNNFTNKIQSIYQKSPLYSFLHSPSKIGTYLLNKNFPEADRIKLWNQAVDYNNNQRITFGYEPLNIPYNKNAIKAADRIDDFLNLFGLKEFTTGRGKAIAWASGPISNMDIRFTSPYLLSSSKHDIMGTAAHELRHGIQRTFSYGRPTILMPNQPMLNDLAIPSEFRGIGLSPAAQRLFNSNFTSDRSNWMRSLNEFDAEMATHRYDLDLNIPYHEWDTPAKRIVQKRLAQRFGISPIDADIIAYDLSTHGYALGGPLYNEDNPIEAFQGNPYIPVVRYDDGGGLNLPWDNILSSYLDVKPVDANVPLLSNNITDEEILSYRVKQGDNLSKIANHFNIPLNTLLEYNANLKSNPDLIHTGAVLNIPNLQISDNRSGTEDQSESEESKASYYTVKRGDTLSKIAKNNNMQLETLLYLNPNIKDADTINIGQKIKLSNVSSTTIAPKQWIDISANRELENEYNTTNLGAIQGSKHESNYVVIDKANKSLTVYAPDNSILYQTDKISTGLSGDDYNTITYTGNKKSIENYKGNNSTPAGITRVSGFSTYHGAPAIQRSRIDSTGEIRRIKDASGKEIPDNVASSLHLGDISKTHTSNGCVRMSKQALEDLSRYVDIGTLIYTLPEKEGSKFVLRDGDLNFIADDPYGNQQKGVKYNKYGKDTVYHDDYNVHNKKTFSPLKIEYTGESDLLGIKKNNIDTVIKSIEDNKSTIQKYMNVSDYHFNTIANLALGIIEQESEYGTSIKYLLKQAADTLGIKDSLKRLQGNNTYDSEGIAQIKIQGDNPEMQKLYKEFGIDEETIQSPEVATQALLLRLLHMFKTEIQGKTFSNSETGQIIDPYDALLYLYKGGDTAKILKNGSATGQNTYITSVKDAASHFKLYMYK